MPPSIMLLQLLWCVGQWNNLTTGGNRGLTAKSKCFFLYSNTGKEWGPYISKYVWGYIPLTIDIHTACKAGKYHENRSFNLFQLCCKAVSFEGTPQTAICDPGLSKCTCKREQKQEILTTHVNVWKVYTNKINSNEINYLLFHCLYQVNSYHKWISIC